jgi:hypothetical protein
LAQSLPPGPGTCALAPFGRRSVAVAAPAKPAKKPRREVVFAARSFASSSNLSPLRVIPPEEHYANLPLPGAGLPRNGKSVEKAFRRPLGFLSTVAG